MKKSTYYIDHLRYLYHWHCIKVMRQKATRFIAADMPCCDPRLVTLSNHILCHGIRVSLLRKQRRGSISSANHTFGEAENAQPQPVLSSTVPTAPARQSIRATTPPG